MNPASLGPSGRNFLMEENRRGADKFNGFLFSKLGVKFPKWLFEVIRGPEPFLYAGRSKCGLYPPLILGQCGNQKPLSGNHSCLRTPGSWRTQEAGVVRPTCISGPFRLQFSDLHTLLIYMLLVNIQKQVLASKKQFFATPKFSPGCYSVLWFYSLLIPSTHTVLYYSFC